MKRLRLCLAALACAPALAHAQTQITIFGLIDTSLNFVDSAGSGSQPGTARLVASGLNGQSRFGFRGSEDLGGDLFALFHIEGAIAADTGLGTATGGGLSFQRRSVVGLGGPFGTVWLGRDYTPGFSAASGADVAAIVGWQYGLYGTTLLNWTVDPTASRGIRWDNGIHYVSHSLGGLTIRAAYALGEQTTPNSGRGNNIGLSGRYEGGPVYAFAYFHRLNDADASTKTRHLGFGGGYNFGTVRVTLAQQAVDPAGPREFVGRNVSVAVKLGNGWLMGQLHRIREDSVNSRGTTTALSYVYAMSKRTDLTVSAGSQRNSANGAYALRASDFQVAPAVAGRSPTGIGFGLAHRF